MLISRLEICPTNRCQIDCPFCHGPDKNNPLEVSPDQFIEKAIVFQEKYGTSEITISGGEPTEYTELFYLMMKLKHSGFKIRLCSNALLHAMLRQCLPYCDHLILPLDGSTPEVVARVRGTDQVYYSVMQFLENERIHCRLSLTCVVCQQNLVHIKDLAELIYRLRMKYHDTIPSGIDIRFFMFTPQMKGNKVKSIYTITNEQYLNVCNRIKKDKHLQGIISHIATTDEENFTCCTLHPNLKVYVLRSNGISFLCDTNQPLWPEQLEKNALKYGLSNIVPHSKC